MAASARFLHHDHIVDELPLFARAIAKTDKSPKKGKLIDGISVNVGLLATIHIPLIL